MYIQIYDSSFSQSNCTYSKTHYGSKKTTTKINDSLATSGRADLCLLDALLEVGDDRRRHVVAPQHVAQLLDLVELLQDGGVRLLHLVRQLQRRLRERDH